MSFSDLMQSGRGPGLIGMLLAMLVLGGFGILFLFAIEDEPQDARLTPEGIILEQEKELAELKAAITQRQAGLDVLPKLQEIERKTRETKRELLFATGRAESTRTGIVEVKAKIAALEDDFIKYKDLYREFSRLGAKGQNLGTLTTKKGTTHEQVIIREVDAVGMAIKSKDGFYRIPYEELPDALQDRFQFDPGQRDAHLAKERGEENNLTAAARQVEEQQKAAQDQRNTQEEGARKAQAKLRITAIRTEMAAIDSELGQLQVDLDREMQKKLRNTNAIKSRIAAKQARKTALAAELARLQSSL
jgi:hypothetical protein